MTDLTIGKTAREAGVNVETIRFYERKGLIDRPRKPADRGYRVYGRDVIDRICFIREAQELGFSLREIAELLSLRADPASDCADVRREAERKRDVVVRKIAELDRIRSALDRLIASCPGDGSLQCCTILDALGGHVAGEDAKRGSAAVTKVRSGKHSPTTRGNTKGHAMRTTTFKISGLRCNACAETVKALVEREEGVRMAAVTFENGEARVLHDPAVINAEALAKIIARPGYRVESWQ